MLVKQKTILSLKQLEDLDFGFEPSIILIFVSPEYKELQESLDQIKSHYPNTCLTGCSTSGEIQDTNVLDNSMILNAIKFESTKHKLISQNIKNHKNSFHLGAILFEELDAEDLSHILILSDGLQINGADLVNGLKENSNGSVSMTGGLAGDGEKFESTFVIKGNQFQQGEVVAIGLYGKNINVAYSSKAGWDSFGLERKVTRSKENILYELDGQPALKVYKKFLGDEAKNLPSSGLLFPLSLRNIANQKPVVRTILAVNEEESSLTFAGNIPEGSYSRFMKANIDRIINGAEDSALELKKNDVPETDFALLISCVGRRLVLKQLVEEEIEAVRDVLGEKPVISGFYSYGELAPFEANTPCELHNQTMTITSLSETI